MMFLTSPRLLLDTTERYMRFVSLYFLKCFLYFKKLSARILCRRDRRILAVFSRYNKKLCLLNYTEAK